MSLSVKYTQAKGYYIAGQSAEFAKYERNMLKSEKSWPFTIEFRDVAGNIVTSCPMPLSPSGKPKCNLLAK